MSMTVYTSSIVWLVILARTDIDSPLEMMANLAISICFLALASIQAFRIDQRLNELERKLHSHEQEAANTNPGGPAAEPEE